MTHDDYLTAERVIPSIGSNEWPPTMTGGGPPKIPANPLFVFQDTPDRDRSLAQKISLYGCLFQLVALFALLWVLTGVVAIIAILT